MPPMPAAAADAAAMRSFRLPLSAPPRYCRSRFRRCPIVATFSPFVFRCDAAMLSLLPFSTLRHAIVFRFTLFFATAFHCIAAADTASFVFAEDLLFYFIVFRATPPLFIVFQYFSPSAIWRHELAHDADTLPAAMLLPRAPFLRRFFFLSLFSPLRHDILMRHAAQAFRHATIFVELILFSCHHAIFCF
jgi:hypothetical protein